MKNQLTPERPKGRQSAEPRPDCYRQLWVSYDEAALITGLKVVTLRSYASTGKIEKRSKGRYRVNRLSLEQYMTSENSKSA